MGGEYGGYEKEVEEVLGGGWEIENMVLKYVGEVEGGMEYGGKGLR